MNDQIGLTEFFAMEAGEYLERLDALVSGSEPPNADELVQLARQLRGSALMAKQEGIATAAAAFERFARGVKQGSRPWDEGTKQLTIRAVDDFKILVRRVGEWTEADDQKAQALAQELDPEGGGRPQRASMVGPLDAGTRAFIGREGAGVASGLAQAAKTLQQSPGTREPLQRVLTMMQPLRGLAVLSDVPPMPDLLDGVERAIGELSRRSEPPTDAPLVFNAAAQALARAAREIASEGTADADSREMQDFAARLGTLVGMGEDVVAIESLFFDDDGPHIVHEGTKTARPTAMGQVELVSHGEHLKLAADQLERAPSGTQRQLRAQALAGTFRALGNAGGDPLQEAVRRFADAAREAVVRGAAIHQTGELATELRRAAEALGRAGEAEVPDVAQRMDTTTQALARLAGGEVMATRAPATPHRPPAASVAGAAAPSAEPTAPAEVPPRVPEPVKAPAAAPAAAAPAPDETPDLFGSWTRYERYAGQLGLAGASLEELLSGPPADPGAPAAAAPARAAPAAAEASEEIVPITDLAYDDAEAVAPTTDVVPITDLLYGGTDALDRALELRAEIRAKLQAGATEGDVVDLIEEVFDLVELGRGQGA
ncbi:MAG: hypothetical protein PVF27_06355 [Gemmatimonadales bacterium]|jgi:hypothetical protein